IRPGDRLSDSPGCLLQADRQAPFQDGPDSPPLRAERVGRAEGHRALLDHFAPVGVVWTGDVETAMTDSTAKPSSAVIVGLGRTGLSGRRYRQAHGWRAAVTDTRAQPPELARLKELDPNIPVRLGGLDTRLLDDAVCVVASPGVSLAEPFFVEARRR